MDTGPNEQTHPETLRQGRERTNGFGLHEALGADLPAPGEGNRCGLLGNEIVVSNCEAVEQGYAPKGCPPVLPVETKRE